MIPRLREVHVVVASWGSCLYDERVLDAAPNLRIICYAAGSIRHVTSPAVFERGVKVTHAAQVIAESVAEHTLTVVLLLLRRIHEFDAAIRAGGWRETHGRELYGKRYGIVGASMVGRSLIPCSVRSASGYSFTIPIYPTMTRASLAWRSPTSRS